MTHIWKDRPQKRKRQQAGKSLSIIRLAVGSWNVHTSPVKLSQIHLFSTSQDSFLFELPTGLKSGPHRLSLMCKFYLPSWTVQGRSAVILRRPLPSSSMDLCCSVPGAWLTGRFLPLQNKRYLEGPHPLSFTALLLCTTHHQWWESERILPWWTHLTPKSGKKKRLWWVDHQVF